MRAKRAEDKVQPILGRILAAKHLTRLQLARLPIHKKIEILVEMQKAARAIHRPTHGRCVHIWKI